MSATEPLEILLLRAAYAAFNSRDIDSALSTMRSDVTWPNGMEGGYVHGHAEIRAYWTRQWSTIDPHVQPVSFNYDSSGLTLVDVHQVVRDLSGAVLLDQRVGHRYTICDGLIQTMEICALPGQIGATSNRASQRTHCGPLAARKRDSFGQP